MSWVRPVRDIRTPLAGRFIERPPERLDADRHAANVLPVVRDIERAGVTTLQGIADALNARGIRTARGRRWHPSTVKNLLGRTGALITQGEAA